MAEINTADWQQGVRFEVFVGGTLRQLLRDQLNISDDYIDNRIAIIFYDGSPVDDIDSLIVKDGAVIALSSQMPGLVGAAMIRKGLISPFRESIRFKPQDWEIQKKKGAITLKLFNTLILELGGLLANRNLYERAE